MSSDISVQSIVPARSANDAVGGAITASVQPSPQPEPVAKSPPIYNPTLRFDSRLGLVVIEFRNDTGGVTTSVPSQRQLEAYQRWATAHIGPAPPGAGIASPPVQVAPVVRPQVQAAPAKGQSVK